MTSQTEPPHGPMKCSVFSVNSLNEDWETMSLNFSNQSRKVATPKGHDAVRKDLESRGVSAEEHCNKVLFQGHGLAYWTKLETRHVTHISNTCKLLEVCYLRCTVHTNRYINMLRRRQWGPDSHAYPSHCSKQSQAVTVNEKKNHKRKQTRKNI